MKKILAIEIENFQSHKNTFVTFNDFSVIVGHSDAGKSAILRALKWCLFNLPDGTRFIRHKQPHCRVQVCFDDNTSIIRYRSSKENYYELVSEKGTMHLEAFGAGPVSDVMNFHGMKESTIFGSRQILNMCDQMTPPFFLTNSPADRAAAIGKMAHTDIIDRAIKNTAGEIREKKSEVKKFKEELSDTRSKLKSYKEITSLENGLEKILKSKEVLENKIKKLESIKKIKLELEQIKLKKEKINEIIDYKDVIENKIELFGKLEKLVTLYNQGLSVYNTLIQTRERKKIAVDLTQKFSVEKIDENIERLNSILEKVKNIQKAKEFKIKKEKTLLDLQKIESILPFKEKLDESISYCDECLERAKYYQNDILPKTESLKSIRERLSNGHQVISKLESDECLYLSEYKNELLLSRKCPVCNSEINEDIINKIGDVV